MTFDAQVPTQLKKTQIWFGSIIIRPIDENSEINPISPSGRPLKEEAWDFIVPSPTLQPIQRMQVYSQQFWWRLLNTLHEDFPLVTRLFGYRDFNLTIGFPYITKYLPDHWSLSYLGSRLPRWIEEEYTAEDKPIVKDAINLDWAYTECFLTAHHPPLTSGTLPKQQDISRLLSKKARLQPHLRLFTMDYDLFGFREEFLKEDPDYWLTHEFPELKKDKRYHFVFFRNLKNNLQYEEVTPGEYQLLERFQRGSTIEKAIQWLENQSSELYSEAASNLHLWLQKWVVKQWLTLAKLNAE